MSNGLKGLYKFGGAAFFVSGLLFLSRAILDLHCGCATLERGTDPRVDRIEFTAPRFSERDPVLRSGLLGSSGGCALSQSRRRRQTEGGDRVRNHGGGHPSLDGITGSSWASGLSRVWHPRQYARPRGVRRRYFLRWSTCDQSLNGNRYVRTESGHEERSVREACGVSRIRNGGG